MRTLLLLLVAAMKLSALPISIYGDTADTMVSGVGLFPGFLNQNQVQNGQNGGGSVAFNYTAVFVFQLPTLGPNEAITSAEFSPYVLSAGSIYPTDLYGLSYRLSSNVLGSDWYSGPGDPVNTLIQSSFISVGIPMGRAVTSAAGNTALLNFLKAQYAAGAQGGEFIFLRLSTNGTNLINASVNFYYAADVAPFLVNAVPGTTLARWQEQYSPVLNLNIEETAAPEPATFFSIGLGLLAAGSLRRR
ncbi:MAG: PEP-CTERM sorting domain-containing protein [Bryobacterales bacterium]|nr:PEP-CTERM sorting domain-containing protein [Bryobacterales bacterium]